MRALSNVNLSRTYKALERLSVSNSNIVGVREVEKHLFNLLIPSPEVTNVFSQRAQTNLSDSVRFATNLNNKKESLRIEVH